MLYRRPSDMAATASPPAGASEKWSKLKTRFSSVKKSMSALDAPLKRPCSNSVILDDGGDARPNMSESPPEGWVMEENVGERCALLDAGGCLRDGWPWTMLWGE